MGIIFVVSKYIAKTKVDILKQISQTSFSVFEFTFSSLPVAYKKSISIPLENALKLTARGMTMDVPAKRADVGTGMGAHKDEVRVFASKGIFTGNLLTL